MIYLKDLEDDALSRPRRDASVPLIPRTLANTQQFTNWSLMDGRNERHTSLRKAQAEVIARRLQGMCNFSSEDSRVSAYPVA